jgi:hypothetical protein
MNRKQYKENAYVAYFIIATTNFILKVKIGKISLVCRNAILILKKFGTKKSCSWVTVPHAYNPSNLGDRDQEDHCLRPAWTKSETLSQKYPTQKRAGGVAQVTECLLSKC